MNEATLALAGGLPIATVFLLLAGLRWSAAKSMAVGWVLAALLGYLLWRMPAAWIAAAAAYGALQALEIAIIIFGAILLMNYLRESGGIATIRWHVTHIVDDRRVQVLLLGLGFMTVIEGVAGFGTPGALAAPLMIGLGFPPMAAVLFGLLFNAPQPPFGAAGTPIIGGVRAVVDPQALAGQVTMLQFVEGVSGWTAVVTGTALVFWGLLGVFLLVFWFGREDERSLRGALARTRPVAALALLLGAVAGGTQFLVAWFFGPELPNIAAGFAVLVVGVALARKGILIPKDRWDFPAREHWAEGWHGGLEPKTFAADSPRKEMPLFLAWTPYLLVAFVLVLTRWPGLGLTETLRGYTLTIPRVLGQDLSYTLRYLYLPGLVPFIPVAVLTGFLHRMRLLSVLSAWRDSSQQMYGPAFTLVVAVSMTQVMIHSATNGIDGPGMMQALSSTLAWAFGAAVPFVAPWIGMIGAFMTGSNTSSNILFAVLQFDAAGAVGVPRTLVVALQNVGGGIGNIVSVLNIAAVSGVVGMSGQEGHILRKALLPTLVFCLYAGLLGLALAAAFHRTF